MLCAEMPRSPVLGLCLLALLLPGWSPLGAATVTGHVPLPPPPAAPVMAKRYEVVSQGGVLSMVPPVAVVYLEGALPLPEAPPDREIVQEHYVFEPALLPIPVGTRVFFPNHDEEYHSVFSYSPTKRFDLGRYPPDAEPVPSQVFDTPGMVTLRCDIHEHMRAIILVLQTSRFVLSDLEGRFELPDVPPGKYTLRAWIDSAQTLSREIELQEDETLEIDLR